MGNGNKIENAQSTIETKLKLRFSLIKIYFIKKKLCGTTIQLTSVRLN